jgi:hypothetical protein
MAESRKRGRRAKFQIRLCEEEYAELERAFSESGIYTRSLIVFQAILTGLRNPKPPALQGKRNRTFHLHISSELKEKIRTAARSHGVTQQALVRAFLFDYIRRKPWETTQQLSRQLGGGAN